MMFYEIMSLDEFNKIVAKEETIHVFLGLLLPMILFGCLSIIYSIETSNNLSLLLWFIPGSYFVIFLFVYEGNIFRKRLKAKSSEYFFEVFTFERSIIRFEFLEKFHKYSVIALILFSVIVSVGVYVAISEKIVQFEDYKIKLNDYDNKIKETYMLSEDELREYFQNQVSQLNTMQTDRKIVSIFGNEFLVNQSNATFAEYHQPGNEVLWDIDSDLDRRKLLHLKFEEMNYDELKIILSNDLKKLKPTSTDYNISDNTFIEYLFLVWLLPGIMVYMLFPFKYLLIKHPDFYYLLSKSCFLIVNKFSNLDEMKKRKYLLMGLNYYEKYIKKNTGMNINRFNEIKSTCINYDSKHLSMISNNFLEFLEIENKLQLLTFIQNKIQVTNSSQFLIHITLAMKIKENWAIIATVISSLITLILYLITYLSKPL